MRTRPLTDEGLYGLLDALGMDTSHRGLHARSLEERALYLEGLLEMREEDVENLRDRLVAARQANEILKEQLKGVRLAAERP